jgi:TPR repeat protein
MGFLTNILRGFSYSFSEGTRKMPRSRKLNDCLKNAEAGDAKSQYTIGIQYEQGNFDFPQDFSEAAKWYRRAAELGHAGARQDLVEAYKWVELAKRGNKLDKFAATDFQKELVKYMTQEQIAEGEKLSREFVPRKKETLL